MFGLPLAFGPRYRKFREACDLVACGGARSVTTEDELQQWFGELHDSGEKTDRAASACRRYVAEHKGATERILREICR